MQTQMLWLVRGSGWWRSHLRSSGARDLREANGTVDSLRLLARVHARMSANILVE